MKDALLKEYDRNNILNTRI
uniref:Uncharacterized protein n=1 Tax=Rhizophora mucronata TaxID=61149 RepID=A0A2P2R524_RHIMU